MYTFIKYVKTSSWTRIMKSRPYFPPNVKILHSTLFNSRNKTAIKQISQFSPTFSIQKWGPTPLHHTQKTSNWICINFLNCTPEEIRKNEKAPPLLVLWRAYSLALRRNVWLLRVGEPVSYPYTNQSETDKGASSQGVATLDLLGGWCAYKIRFLLFL